MKKEDVVVINILTSVGILAVLVLMLVFGTGSNLYGSIVNNINSASVEGLSNANIYDICYYKGFAVVYGISYSIALFTTVISAAALFLRKKGAVRLAGIAGVSNMLTAAIVLLSVATEGSVTVHRFIAGFYLKDVAKTFDVTKALGILPVIFAVIILILSAALLICLRMTGIGKLKVYNSGAFDVCMLIVPVIYGSIVIETIREIFINVVCDKANGMKMTVQTFIKDYYFVKGIDFNMPYAWFAVALVLAVIIFYNRLSKKFNVKKFIFLVSGVEVAVIIARAVIYFLNPPRLFGYLTLDDAVCDATEAAYPAYIFMYILDVVLILTITCCIMLEADNKKILMLCGIHAVISIVAVLAGQFAGVAGIYYACAIADIIALVCLLYMTYVGRSNH